LTGDWAAAALVDTRHEYQHLFSIYVPIAIGVFAVIVLAIAFCVLRYRRRPVERAARWNENNRLEGAYALALAGVVVFLLYLTFTAEHRVDTVSAREKPSVIIDVVSAKWEWSFRYRSYGITRRSGTVGRQALVVPTGEAIRFNLSSVDVIHGFWVPEIRFKRDVFPGITQSVTLMFPRAGSFQAQCSEFCGLRHAEMLFDVRAVTPSAFASWARSGGRATVS
jgi:cytochrome c oxidase subunit 2